MSESAPEVVPADASERDAQALTPSQIDSLLADFRRWLEEQPGESPPGEPAEIDLASLLDHFVALRHEIHLHTRSTRAQQEQMAEALTLVQRALDALQQPSRPAPPAVLQDPEEQLRPQLKALIELHDALALGAREVQRVQEGIRATLPEVSGDTPAPPPTSSPLAFPPFPIPAVSTWARLLGARAPDPQAIERWQKEVQNMVERTLQERLESHRAELTAERERRQQTRARLDQTIQAIVTGYTMGLQRIERALQQQSLQPIPAVGHPFDPERMEVLEAVSDTGHPSGQVLEEVRRGYLWRGRVFRYAQVRVAKS